MHNITNVPCISKCYACNKSGFFIDTPGGADYYTCPCCRSYDYLNVKLNFYMKIQNNDNKLTKIYNEYHDAPDEKPIKDLRIEWQFCDKCKIMYEDGCVHYDGGCASYVYNAHFISKWKYKNGTEIFLGMPKFDDEDEWFDKANEIEILDKHCPHMSNRCKHGYSHIPVCDCKFNNKK